MEILMVASLLLNLILWPPIPDLTQKEGLPRPLPRSLISLASSRRFRRLHSGTKLNGDPNIIKITAEIEAWMSQPDQNMSNMPDHLKEVVDSLNQTANEHVYYDDTERIFRGANTYCGPCKVLAAIIIGYSRIGGPINIIANFLVKICYLLAFKSTRVCKGLIYQDKDRLNYIIRNTNVDASALCSLVLGSQGCGPFKGPSWTIQIPHPHLYGKHHSATYRSLDEVRYKRHPLMGVYDPYSQRARQRSIDFSTPNDQTFSTYTDQKHPPLSHYSANDSGKKTLKVLHLTDPHFDPFYKIGSNAVCEAPLCCNHDSGHPKSPMDAAGKWGDYRSCDTPKWLLENMFSHILTQHPDIDYIICTGDVVPHHMWKIHKGGNIDIIKQMTSLVQYHFPHVPIYGSIGNHESFPRDSYPPPEIPEVFSKFGNQWLYDVVSDGWERLLKQPLPASARFGGYYSVLGRPGLRIISINTNFCYILNWWVLYKPIDPGHVLKWLTEELQGAEDRGEFVHIIGHIPPLYVDCFDQWAHQFSRIISRYSHIVKGQFYGHSHLDEYRVHYDVKEHKKPIGVEYITPNNGPFNNLNPSYRVFYVDGDYSGTTRDILDYETWAMNLTHANMYDDPRWYKLYSARQDLYMNDLSPHSWDLLTKRLAKDPLLFARYYRYQVQDSDAALYKGCDKQCRRETICSIVDGDAFMPQKCRPA